MFVVKVDLQNTLFADAHLDIAHVDVLDDTATAGVSLYAKHTLQFWRVHHTVVGEDVLATT